jgi:hypothetical protein
VKTSLLAALSILLTAASPLLAEGPASPEMEPFAALVGDWECATFSPDAEGGFTEGRAEWRFWWILDGHALMDEWRSPKPDGSGEFVGVNIRQWNRTTGAYEAAWLESATLDWDSYECAWNDGVFVMEGDAETPDGRKGLSRITFHDITGDSFQWRMDWSMDGGATWQENVFRIEGTRED